MNINFGKALELVLKSEGGVNITYPFFLLEPLNIS